MCPASLRPRVLIPVFFTAELSAEVSRINAQNATSNLLTTLQVLNDFLQQAYIGVDETHHRLCVVNHFIDSSSVFQPSTAPIEVLSFPFVDYTDRQLGQIANSEKRLTDAAFVILDDQTRKDGCTCRLVGRKEVNFFCVRSEFKGAQRSLDSLLYGSTNIQRLRNEAAMSGGYLKHDRNPSTHVANTQKVVSLLNRPATTKTWETCCKPSCGLQNFLVIPVFCIAELPLHVG